MIQIDLEGVQQVFETLNTLPQQLQAQAVARLADKVFQDVQNGADMHTKTGALARSVEMHAVQDGYDIFHDLQHAPHAPFVHWGTIPHDIRPKNKKSLRWPSGGSGFMFSKLVKHPGYAGDPYMQKAADNAAQHMQAIVQQLQAQV